MGTRFVPSFANLYVGDFEMDFIYGNHKWWYIDDLIFGEDLYMNLKSSQNL